MISFFQEGQIHFAGFAFLDLLRFIVLIVFLVYGLGELRFREIGTKNRRLVNINVLRHNGLLK